MRIRSKILVDFFAGDSSVLIDVGQAEESRQLELEDSSEEQAGLRQHRGALACPLSSVTRIERLDMVKQRLKT